MGNFSQYNTEVWYYKSISFKTALNLINYFNNYNLFTKKYKNYLKFRKIYIMIIERKYLKKKGIKKL